MLMKTDGDDFIKKEVTANVIESDEVTFLCGEETLMNLRTTLDFGERKLGFKEHEKEVQLIKGSHLLVKLELVGRWKEEDAVFMIEKEEDVKTLEAVKKIHKALNHKSKEQMQYAFRSAGKLDGDTRRLIKMVMEQCEVCKKSSQSKPRPSVAISRTRDFNSMVSLDLKSCGYKYIL